MIGEYRFFNEFFDGQIVKPESQKMKLFKLILVSVVSALGLFFTLYQISTFPLLILLVCGMIWNIYCPLGKNIAIVFGVIVGIIYCVYATIFRLYSNALVYIGLYIPLQLIAISKDYSEGDFIQIKKTITDLNKIIFVIFFAILCVAFVLFNYSLGGRYIIVDAIAAGLLVCSALLRNERYLEYYIFRIFALVLSIVLWINVIIEYQDYSVILIIFMYASYLIYDVVSYFYQSRSYVNQYMLVLQKQKDSENEKLAEQKIEIYRKSQKNKNKEI